MKLLSCHIENFGIFSNEDFSFASGLNPFLKDNGAGKSTLAAFIRAMFYGLPKNTKANQSRAHYYPFNKGLFGGNLIFEKQGHTYRVERTFDAKSETKDEVRVYRDSIPYASDNLGLELFGLDEEAFARSIFIASNDLDLVNDSIAAKLGGIVIGEEDEKYQGALKNLESAITDLKAKKGNGGKIPAKALEISEIEQQIRNKEEIEKALPKKYASLNALNERAANLAKEKEASHHNELLLKDKAQLEEKQVELDGQNAKLLSMRRKYPFGLPSIEECERAERLYEERAGLANKLSSPFAYDNEFALSSRVFKEHPLGEGALEEKEEEIAALRDLDRDIASLSHPRGSLDEALIYQFENSDISEEKIEELKAKQARIDELRKTENKEIEVEPAKRFTGLPYLLSGIFAAIAVVGIVLLIMQYYLIGTIFSAVGGVGAIASIVFMILLPKRKTAPEEKRIIKDEDNIREQIRLEMEIGAALEKYKENKDEPAFGIKNLEIHYRQYKELSEKEGAAALCLSQLSKKREDILKALDSFFASYGIIEGGEEAKLATLKAKRSSYENLTKKKIEYEESRKSALERESANQEELNSLLGKYHVDDDGRKFFKDASIALPLIKAIEGEIERKKADIAAFKEKYPTFDLKEVRDKDAIDLDIQENANALLLMQKEIAEDEENTADLAKLRNDLLVGKDELAELKHKQSMLKLARDYLEQSDRELKSRYLKPVQDRFDHYSSLIAKTIEGKAKLDVDYHLQVEMQGSLRDELHLSDGQKMVCSICLRLSLAEEMFKEGEVPFLILDDPFASLDDKHLDSCLSLLKELGKKEQIFYFTCHPSRDIA